MTKGGAKMKKIFTRSLCFYMLIALMVTIAAIFSIQTAVSQRDNLQSSMEKLEEVRQTLIDNQEEIEQLTNSLGENNLAKTRAFADLLKADSTILQNSPASLEQIKERLMVSELHIIDEQGIITHSTIGEYIGFDMGSGEQSAAFLNIIDDNTLEIVQEPQENAAEHTLMQYVGVARQDGRGIVQVGIRPEVLEHMLQGTEINVVLQAIDFGKTGYIYAVDAVSGIIVAHPNSSLIGQAAEDHGIPWNSSGEGKTTIEGVEGYYVAEEYEGNIIGTFMPTTEYYEDRFQQTLVVSLSMFAIFVVLLLMINRLLDRKIVRGVHQISDSLEKIAAGDFMVSVHEDSNPEFKLLSANINKMVESMRTKIQENEELVKLQKGDMEKNLELIENVKQVCTNLNDASQATLSNARSIQSGTGEQELAVKDLKNVMEDLADKLNTSADTSTQVATVTKTATEKMIATGKQMEDLEDSIQKISQMSEKIGKIIGEINSIASQTKMLSLNASIEAARAGDAGKGFAVVAIQVGELATRSAQAAKETGELIMSSIEAVESGKEITEQTVSEFVSVVSEIEHASQSVEEITGMVLENVAVVAQAVEGLHRIYDVVEKNVEIAQNSEQVSTTMTEEAERLQLLVQ